MNDERARTSSTRGAARGENGDEGEDSLRQRVEEGIAKLIPDLVKRTIEAGIGTLSRADTSRLRSLVGDLKVPRDVAKYFLAQVDDTKNALLKVFAGEVRDFLESTDLAEDLRKVLTSVSLEVSTRVRFVPNDPAQGGKAGGDDKAPTEEGRPPKRGKRKGSE